MKHNKNNLVIVTGANKGLGLAISKRLDKSNYDILGIGRHRSKEFDKLNNNKNFFIEFDLLEINKIPKLVNQILAKTKKVPYGLINNAGIGLDGVLATQHASDISKILKLNLEAPITLSKYIVRHMIKERKGRIINISSIIAKTGFNGLAVYGASKAGLEGFTRSLAREVGRFNITVNAVAPGYMLTDMTIGLDKSKLDSIVRRAPLGLPQTENVAFAIEHLLDPLSEKTTGTILTVDGGSTA